MKRPVKVCPTSVDVYNVFLLSLQNIDNNGPLSSFTGQRLSLQEDNLVHMARQSQSQSSLSPENTSRKKSKKKKEGKGPVSGQLSREIPRFLAFLFWTSTFLFSLAARTVKPPVTSDPWDQA